MSEPNAYQEKFGRRVADYEIPPIQAVGSEEF
jgi:hypothetical protein